MDKLPEELSPERVDGWIDLIEARKSIPDWVWIDFSEPEAGRGFARQLNHFLPRTLKRKQVTLFGEEEVEVLSWEKVDDSTAINSCYR